MSKLQEEKLHGSKEEGLAKIGRAQVRASREQEREECHAPGEKGYPEIRSRGKGGPREEPQAGHQLWTWDLGFKKKGLGR